MITIEALKQEDMPQLIELYKELIPPHIEFNTSFVSPPNPLFL